MNPLLGVRFATGTRDGRMRTALVALASGFAIALLLLAVSIPGALAARAARSSAQEVQRIVPAGRSALLWGDVDFVAESGAVTGAVVRAVRPGAALPRGVAALPRPGSMLVSPALRDALASGRDAELAARLPYRIGGTIGQAGLLGPTDLRFIAVDARLSPSNLSVGGVQGFRPAEARAPLDPLLTLLAAVGVLIVLLPVGIVVLIAGRFGAERRDRRLAALRLTGLSTRGVVVVTAVEALTGGMVGVAVGALLFLLGRRLTSFVSIASLSVFPGDVNPAAPLAVLVLLAVPAGVVLAAVAGLHRVAVEPLGVTRRTRRSPRRLWWRLIPLLAAVPLLAGARDAVATRQGVPGVVAGAALLLVGVVALLAWAVERIARLSSGSSVAWRFARGRLVHEGGTTGRVVGVVAVALAGAIALQTLFAGLAGVYGAGPEPAEPATVLQSAQLPGSEADRLLVAATRAGAAPVLDVYGVDETALTVGSCAALRRLTALPSCADGDVFATAGGHAPTPGAHLRLSARSTWTVPARVVAVPRGTDASGAALDSALLVTTGAVRPALADSGVVIASVPKRDGPALLAVFERIDPLVQLTVAETPTSRSVQAHRYESVRRGLDVGLVLVLLLIGGVLLVAVVDQLRERREALAALAAMGMRRRAMVASILWESALPVVVGAVVATAAGFALGGILLGVLSRPLVVDPAATALALATALAVPMLVTAAALPAALRLMRPEGLRAE